MIKNIKQWIFTCNNKYTKGHAKHDSKVKYVALPQQLNELDDSYKNLMRELSKR